MNPYNEDNAMSEITVLVNCLKDHGYNVEIEEKVRFSKLYVKRSGHKGRGKKIDATRESVLNFLGY